MITVLLWFAEHRNEHSWPMQELYQYYGISRQGFAQAAKRYRETEHLTVVLGQVVRDIRIDHPRMGLRKIYHRMQPLPIGRDRFERVMSDFQLQVRTAVPAWKTTLTQRLLYFPNRIAGLTVTHMHQVWVTDITYFWLPGRFAYIVVIEDVYTRLILAAVASRSLRAESNIAALTIALEATAQERIDIETIHHSDRGGQYIDKEYLKLLKKEHMQPSMCIEAYENGYVERVIGTLKHEYLLHRHIQTFDQLVEELERTVILYNTERPHRSLPNMMTPAVFKQWVADLPKDQRPVVEIYDSSDDRSTLTKS